MSYFPIWASFVKCWLMAKVVYSFKINYVIKEKKKTIPNKKYEQHIPQLCFLKFLILCNKPHANSFSLRGPIQSVDFAPVNLNLGFDYPWKSWISKLYLL